MPSARRSSKALAAAAAAAATRLARQSSSHLLPSAQLESASHLRVMNFIGPSVRPSVRLSLSLPRSSLARRRLRQRFNIFVS